jgi:pimeloyl-ACP methyl ester carboxylesterase
VTGAQVAAELGGLIDEVDESALTGDFAGVVADAFRRAVSAGIAGWRDDDRAFVRPWGFDLADLRVPVSVWQGAHDRMVPLAHGQWLAKAVPGAAAHLFDDEGHLSLVLRLDEMLVELRGLAGR